MPSDLRFLADEDYCYLTTKGRVTGTAHEIEIWFALQPVTRALYMLSDSDRSDWVKNLRQDSRVTVRVAGERFEGRARVVEDPAEDELARRLLVGKYEDNPGSLANWGRTALPVAVDLGILR
ncbi:MAG: nitroreductase family deazaflavin-dependent oxidoreductase [Actinomycetota bacterium]|nr:nitroreductase family deazaflavin-dependent oxidoreductase [Actinomycetota bacterium]